MSAPGHSNQRGSAALLGLFFGLAMLALISAATSLTSIHLRSAARARGEASARAAAESGAAACLSALAAGKQTARLSGTVPGGTYRARCSWSDVLLRQRATEATTRRGSEFAIESTGGAESAALHIDCRLRLRGVLQDGRVRYTACSVSVSRRTRRDEP